MLLNRAIRAPWLAAVLTVLVGLAIGYAVATWPPNTTPSAVLPMHRITAVVAQPGPRLAPTGPPTTAPSAVNTGLQGAWQIDEANLQDGLMVWMGNAALTSGGTIVFDAHKESVAGRPATPCERQTILHVAFALSAAQQPIPYRETNCTGSTSAGEVRVGSISTDGRAVYGSFWQGGVKLGDLTATKQ